MRASFRASFHPSRRATHSDASREGQAGRRDGFGGQALAYLRPYWAPGLLVLLTQTPSVVFVTVQPLLLRGLIDAAVPVRNGTATVRTRTPCLMLALERDEFLSLLRAAPELRARVEEVAERRRAAQATFR